MAIRTRFGLCQSVGAALLYALLAAGSADARPGDLDPSFGLGGFVTTDFGTDDGASDVAIQPDGRIVAVGFFSGEFTVARYNPNGALDPGFGGDGLVETGFGAEDGATSVALQPNGKIVAAGVTEAGPSPSNFALVRYNPDGSLDAGFDGDGMLFTDFGGDDAATDVALTPNGGIVATGLTTSGAGAADYAFASYLANGSPDNSFDGDGLQTVDFGALDYATDAEIQPDGGVVATGMSGGGVSFAISVARLTSSGAPDPSFSGNGLLTTEIGDFASASAVALQPDGRIVVSGTAGSGGGGDAAMVRYRTDGALDPSFGAGGVLIVGALGESMDLAIQPDGKIVARAGASFSLARFNPEGSADAGFGNGGFASVDFGPGSFATALALQPDGRIVAAGITDAGPNPGNFGLVRLAGGEPEPPAGPSPTCAGRVATILAAPGKRTKGTPGDDVIVGTARRDRIKARGGNDVVCTLAGKARVEAGPGRDLVIGGNRKDVLSGAGGRDRLRGKRGNDRLLGGGGADLLVGGKGPADHCLGGPGRDRSRGC